MFAILAKVGLLEVELLKIPCSKGSFFLFCGLKAACFPIELSLVIILFSV